MIELKDIQGNILLSVPITQSCQKVEELMVADYIQLSWDSNLSDEIPLGAYIEYNGERYSLLEPYNPTQKNESNYTYTPKFESRVRAWGKKPFFFYSGESKEPDWTLTSNPADFMRCVCDAILKETGESWTYSIDASLAVSASLSFSSSDILSGLNQIADAFETEWLADKETNTIYLGLLSYGEEVTLEVGNNIGVPSIQNSKEGYYTRFYAFGSTRNITQDYTGSNTNNLVNKRLTLDPNKYPQGYKDIRVGLSKGEIFSKVLIFDNVYPSSKLSISGVRNRLMYRLDDSGDKIQLGTDESGNPIYDQYTIWYFRLEGFTFDWNNVIEGLTPSISFQSGALNGREFEIIYHDKSKKITTSDGLTFEVKEGDYEICFVEENNLIIPSMTGLIPNDGDKVIVFNIKMPSEYTQSAYIELEEELDKAIARMTSDLNNYSFKSNPVVFNESNPDLSIGRKVRYVNGSYSYSTRVIKLNTQLDFPIEQTITIGNEKVKGNTQQLREEVVSANKDLNLMSVFNNMTQSLQQSYNRTQQMMLEGFAAIKNIWQIRETENGEKYIFSAYDVATQKGITMYHDGKMLNLPSLASGLPFDGRTIWYNPDTNQIEVIGGTGGGSGEGVSNFWDLSGIPSWITNSKPKYSYSEIDGTPDLTQYALVSQIPSLFGYATESWVNQQNYAIKATTLSGYGITDAYTKTSVDDLLLAYVTLGGRQTITGEKNFTGGLKVNGSPIYYDTEKKYWKLEGDLLVTGGVTMYGSDSSFVPSTIMDAIAVDGTTISKDGGVLKVIGCTGGGVADSVAWANITGKPTWIGSSKPSYSYSEITGAISTTELQNYLTQNSYLNVTSGDNRYLMLSGGTLTLENVDSFKIRRNKSNSYGAYIAYETNDGVLGRLGMYRDDVEVYFGSQTAKSHRLLHEGNYSNYALPLSGGTLSSNLTIQNKTVDVITLYRDDVNNSPSIKFTNKSDGTLGYIGVLGSGSDIGIQPFFMDSVGSINKIWHSGNFNPSNYLLLSGGTMTGNILLGGTTTNKIGTNIVDTTGGFQEFTHQNSHGYIAIGPFNGSVAHIYTDRPSFFFNKDLYVNNAKVWNAGNDGSGSGLDADLLDGKQPSELNVGSATKLQTARTIWGQSFDGTGNVSGVLTLPLSHQVQWADSGGAMIYAVSSKRIIIDGSVGIGTTSPDSKAHILSSEFNILKVARSNAFGAGIYFSNSNGELGDIGFHDNKNFVIRNSAHDANLMELSQSGNLLVIGGMTMYSQRSLKNVVNERGLSLSELSAIKPTRYTWKDGRDNRLHFGGIADDIQQVLPEVVYSTSDGILTMDYGNAAFAVASSLIQPVVNHEKRIAILEEENKQLRQEVERLKSA